MSKVITTNLFRLIHSLSKSEKRMFKLQSVSGESSSKKFILLFDEIEKQKNYDEKKILNKRKELIPHQLPNLKAHLYKKILKTLQFSNANRLPEMYISEMIDYSRILYSKCLYRECVEMIDKAKRMAIENDSRLLLLELLEIEKMAMKQREGISEENRINQIINETIVTSESVNNINLFSNLSLKLTTFYQRIGFIRNKEDFEKVKTFFSIVFPIITNHD